MKGFSDYIAMKCAKATFERGKLEQSDHVRLDEETMIKDLEQQKVRKDLNWNLSEVKKLNIKVRKMTKRHSMHHPQADIHRIYLPRIKGGRGLSQLELFYKTSTIGLFRYLNLSDDWMLRLALK